VAEQLRAQLDGIDGLVLVHPDFPEELPDELFQNLAFATFYLEKPIIVVPDIDEANVRTIFPKELTDRWLCVAATDYFVPRRVVEEFRDERPLSALTIGFGGLLYKSCVAAVASKCGTRYEGPGDHRYEEFFPTVYDRVGTARVIRSLSLDRKI